MKNTLLARIDVPELCLLFLKANNFVLGFIEFMFVKPLVFRSIVLGLLQIIIEPVNFTTLILDHLIFIFEIFVLGVQLLRLRIDLIEKTFVLLF